MKKFLLVAASRPPRLEIEPLLNRRDELPNYRHSRLERFGGTG